MDSKSKKFIKGPFPKPSAIPEQKPSTDWRQIRDDLLNASQERTEAEIAYVEAGQTRAAAEQAEQAAAQRLTAAQKRHEQARSRAGVAS
jgi:hypothetical protein